MSGTAQRARLLDASLAHLPRFKPGDWRADELTAGTYAGDNSLDSQIARARREMGEDRWNSLQSEWEQR